MRGKTYCWHCTAAWIAGLIVVVWSGLAQAWNFPDMFQDPLSVEPPILHTGQRFPGGTEPMPCPPSVDLTQTLALGDAVDVALCNNAQLKEAWAEIKIQSGALGETRATFSPTVTGTFSPLNSTTQYPAYPSANTSTWGHVSWLELALV